jgi:hypothetical protein
MVAMYPGAAAYAAGMRSRNKASAISNDLRILYIDITHDFIIVLLLVIG